MQKPENGLRRKKISGVRSTEEPQTNMQTMKKDMEKEAYLLPQTKEFKECVSMMCSLVGQHKFMYLIDLARRVPYFPESLKTKDTQVFGCMSVAHVLTDIKDNKILIQVDSDSQFVKGVLYILRLYVNGQSIDEFIKTPSRYLMETLGLENAITSRRTNGLYSAIMKVKEDIIAYGNKNALPKEEK